MKRFIIKLTAVATILSTVSISTVNESKTVSADGEQPDLHRKADYEKVIPGELIVMFKEKSELKQEQTIEKNEGRIAELADEEVALVSFDENKLSTDQMLERLEQDKAIAYAQPNYNYTVSNFSNDEYANLQWGLHNTGQSVKGELGKKRIDIHLPEAWDLLKDINLKETIVAVLDTGIDINHPDLADHIWINENERKGKSGVDDDGNGFIDDVNGWDFYRNNARVYNSEDDDVHGTHVAGTIAASINNNIGIAGIAPNVKIMPLKFIGPDGGTTFSAIQAIQYAKDNGAQIVNNSWSGVSGHSGDVLEQAIENSGMLFVVAAGNEGIDIDKNPKYPASYTSENMIKVAAVDSRGYLAKFSNYGFRHVDVAAPGVSILSTVPRNQRGKEEYRYYSGTSMATPHVSGTAALLLGLYGDKKPSEIVQVLKESGTSIVSLDDMIFSGKMINAGAAVESLLPINFLSVKEFNTDSEFVEGQIETSGMITATNLKNGKQYKGATNEVGFFRIKVGKLEAGAKLVLKATAGMRQSKEKTLIVVGSQKQDNTLTEEVNDAPIVKATFKDVGTHHWAFSDIEWAVKKNLIKGYPDHHFKPEHSLTEAQLAAIMSQYFNPQISKIKNKGAWYDNFYSYLRKNEIILPGHNDKRVIEKSVTRLTLARSLAASQGVRGSDKKIVDWMYSNELTNGRGKYKDKYKDFGGADHLKRAHIPVFFRNMEKKKMKSITH